MVQGGSRRRRASLAEVAELAGVAVSTVSKVANGSPDVADATRERVARILRDRGYVATRKRTRSRPSLVLLARDMDSPYTLEVFRGAMGAAEEALVDISVTIYPNDADDLNWIDAFHASGRSGVIAVTSILDEAERERFRARGLPLVVVDPLNSPDQQTYSIGATNWAGGLEATEHVIKLGHHRIAMLSGVADAMVSRARVSGYLAAMQSAGLSVDSELIVGGDFSYESGRDLALALLKSDRRPTAFVAASDTQALGVIEAARQARLRVPDDLSVVGFDDVGIARMSAPPLTTVRQPLAEMGELSVSMMSRLISGSVTHPHHTELATTLVVRESTAAPPPPES